MKKTQWFKNTAPARRGVYERKFPWGVRCALWTGQEWMPYADSVAAALRNGTFEPSAYQSNYYGWRGLTTKDGK